MSEFEKELKQLINRHSKERGSNTPDWILAEYLIGCLNNFNCATKSRTDWYKGSKEFAIIVGEESPPVDPTPPGTVIPKLTDIKKEEAMTTEEKFALKQALANLQHKIETYVGYIRRDSRGDVQRERYVEIQKQLKIIYEFIEEAKA